MQTQRKNAFRLQAAFLGYLNATGSVYTGFTDQFYHMLHFIVFMIINVKRQVKYSVAENMTSAIFVEGKGHTNYCIVII